VGARRDPLGSTEQVTLSEGHTELAEHREPRVILDPFRDDLAARAGGEVGQPRDHRLAGWIPIHPAHEADVDLQEARPELDDGAEAGEPGSGVVDRQADPWAKTRDRSIAA
jgi:hypothetical protein